MKSNILKNCKWLILALVLVFALGAVSISYSSWDNFSLKSGISANNGNFLDYTIKLEQDNDNNGIISVGDIILYGRFYQAADAVDTNKVEPLRWLVVDIDSTTKVATLLTEKAVVFGNYWGSVVNEQSYNINYYHSTPRSWLNSGKGSLKGSGTTWNDVDRYYDNTRSDGVGSLFGINQANQVNKGFLDVAFSDEEKSILVPKRMDNIKTVHTDGRPQVDKTSDGRTFINDLVWVPSFSEIYDVETTPAIFTQTDGTPNKQFSYFRGTTILQPSNKIVCGATDYAMNATKSSYFANGYGSTAYSTATNARWLSRTSDYSPSDHNDAFFFDSTGLGFWEYPNAINYGIRPGVCIKL